MSHGSGSGKTGDAEFWQSAFLISFCLTVGEKRPVRCFAEGLLGFAQSARSARAPLPCDLVVTGC